MFETVVLLQKLSDVLEMLHRDWSMQRIRISKREWPSISWPWHGGDDIHAVDHRREWIVVLLLLL